ncbi:MAG: helix-turn-helix domain-containing protein [Bacilli bacterium]|jgi:AraC-like DNA-binding protein|nr:helix-turn-helix domain-containing protein [Bacilli bacterium]
MDGFLCPANQYADGEEKIIYDSPSFPIYFHEGRISFFLNRKAFPHYHKDFEYIKILQGELGYEVNGKKFLLKEGEGIFINVNAIHYGFGIGLEDCDFLCLLFPSLLLANCPEVDDKFVAPYLNKESAILFKKDSLAMKTMDQLWEEKNRGGNPLIYSSLLFRLWQETLTYFSKDPASSSSSLTILKNAVSYLRTHYMENISLSSFSQALAVSTSYLTKLFRNYLHYGPMEYLANYRLDLASEKLKESGESIKTIAFEVGYESANFFTRAFKKKYGIAPKAYRKRESSVS